MPIVRYLRNVFSSENKAFEADELVSVMWYTRPGPQALLRPPLLLRPLRPLASQILADDRPDLFLQGIQLMEVGSLSTKSLFYFVVTFNDWLDEDTHTHDGVK